MVKLGSRPIGLAEAVLGEINFLRPQQGRVKAGSSSPKRGFSFSVNQHAILTPYRHPILTPSVA
jgi:hypothetical protein